MRRTPRPPRSVTSTPGRSSSRPHRCSASALARGRVSVGSATSSTAEPGAAFGLGSASGTAWSRDDLASDPERGREKGLSPSWRGSHGTCRRRSSEPEVEIAARRRAGEPAPSAGSVSRWERRSGPRYAAARRTIAAGASPREVRAGAGAWRAAPFPAARSPRHRSSTSVSLRGISGAVLRDVDDDAVVTAEDGEWIGRSSGTPHPGVA